MNRHRLGSPLPVLVLALVLAACQGGGAGPASPAASRSGSPSNSAQPVARTLVAGCSDSSPCQLSAGAYRLGPGTLLPGLEVTVPAGWSSTESTPSELNLASPAQPDDALKFWLDMSAVKSSGPGHGTTVLTNVGRTPSAVIAWLSHDPDFLIVSGPWPATVGQDIKMTSLVVGVSHSANYGDPGCPASPRCADLFTTKYWGSNFFGIAGDEEVRLYLGTIQIGGSPHTFFAVLDTVDHAGLLRFENTVKPIIGSLRLPSGVVSG